MNYTQKGLMCLIASLALAICLTAITGIGAHMLLTGSAWLTLVEWIRNVVGFAFFIVFFTGWWYMWKGRKEYGEKHEKSVWWGGICVCCTIIFPIALLLLSAVVLRYVMLGVIFGLVVSFFLLLGTYYNWMCKILLIASLALATSWAAIIGIGVRMLLTGNPWLTLIEWVRNVVGFAFFIVFLTGWWHTRKGRKEYGENHEMSVWWGGVCVVWAIIFSAALAVLGIFGVFIFGSVVSFFLILGAYYNWVYKLADRWGNAFLNLAFGIAAVSLIIAPVLPSFIPSMSLTPEFLLLTYGPFLAIGVALTFVSFIIAYVLILAKIIKKSKKINIAQTSS